MPRDFDFKRTPIRRSTPLNRTAPQKAKWWLLIIVLGLALMGGALFMQANQPASVAGESITPTPSAGSPTITSTEVQIFDGGGGEAAANALIPILSNSSINARFAGKTLLTYEVTEIWYDKDYQQLAQRVAVTISAKTPKLTESKVAGVFTVQVFVGKK